MVFLDILLLIVGLALLVKGADFFVDGSSKIAKALKIPSLIIGLTLVSIGTSMPEFSVSLTSSIQGINDISFGNIIGSDIFNTFIVIGVSALFTPLTVSKHMKRYDMPILIGIYILILILGFVITPLVISLVESIIIFVLFFAYTAFLILRSKNELKEEKQKEDDKPRKWYFNVLIAIVGLTGIIGGGQLVVNSASSIALELGMSEMLVGLTIVAIGTSLPELVTSIVAAKKGENDIAIGNAIGSNIFNIILILGVCGIITPIAIDWADLFDVLVMLGSGILVFLLVLKSNSIGRYKGIVMIVIYVAYLTYIVLRDLGILAF